MQSLITMIFIMKEYSSSFCLIKKKQKIKNKRYTARLFSSNIQLLYKVNSTFILGVLIYQKKQPRLNRKLQYGLSSLANNRIDF